MALWHAHKNSTWAFKSSTAPPLTPTHARAWRASLMPGQGGPTNTKLFPTIESNVTNGSRNAVLQRHGAAARPQFALRPYCKGLNPMHDRSRCSLTITQAANQHGMTNQPGTPSANHAQPAASQPSVQQDSITAMHMLSSSAQLQPQRLSASSPPWSSTSKKASKPQPASGPRPQLQVTASTPTSSPNTHTSSKPSAASKPDNSGKAAQKQPSNRKATKAAADAKSSTILANKPGSLWMRLLSLVMILAGRALSALAMAFCLVALLLLRPRAVGADATAGSSFDTPSAAQSAADSSSSSIDIANLSSSHQTLKPPVRNITPPFASMTASMTAPIAARLAQPAAGASTAVRNAANPSVAALAADDAAQQLESGLPVEGSPGLGSPAVATLSGAALLAAHEAAVTALFKSVQAGVVNISGARAAGTFSSLDVTRALPGVGSGFIWDDRGHVVTAYSCVRGAAEVKVTLADAATYTAKLVGWDAGKDVAVLRLSLPKARLKELVPVKLGAVSGAAGLALGAPVWGLGNASGLDHTLTQGIVSGLGRELPGGGPYPLKGLIQTDAACGHQSGGVLLNSQGRLVGMVVAPSQAGGRAAGYGLGYALPVDSLRGLVSQILVTGNQPTRPSLGVTLAPPQVLAAQGVDGVLVLEVPPGSPAAVAGLRHTHRDIFGDVILGDVIVGIEGMPVKHAGDLYIALDQRKAGDRVRIDILRDGKSTSLTVVLGERGRAGALEE